MDLFIPTLLRVSFSSVIQSTCSLVGQGNTNDWVRQAWKCRGRSARFTSARSAGDDHARQHREIEAAFTSDIIATSKWPRCPRYRDETRSESARAWWIPIARRPARKCQREDAGRKRDKVRGRGIKGGEIDYINVKVYREKQCIYSSRVCYLYASIRGWYCERSRWRSIPRKTRILAHTLMLFRLVSVASETLKSFEKNCRTVCDLQLVRSSDF